MINLEKGHWLAIKSSDYYFIEMKVHDKVYERE